MAEYAFNPDTGSGEVVGATPQAEPTSAQERSDLQQSLAFRNTSEHLSQRAQEKEGNDITQVASGSIEIEQRLLATQKEMSDINSGKQQHDPLKLLQLEALATKLAGSLVGEESQPEPTQQQEPEKESTADVLRAEYGEQQVNETLQFASDNLSEEVSTALNDELAGDGDQAHVVYSALETIRKNPDVIGQGEVTSFDLATANELASQYGKVGEVLAALNAGLAAGKCTRAEAASFVMKNPDLAQVAISAASQGLIKLAL